MTARNDPFAVTDAAAAHFESQLSAREGSWGIRIDLMSNGCSGHSYVVEFFDDIQCQGHSKHHPVVVNGINFAINPLTEFVLQGMEIDYVTEGLNSGLQFNNPNETGQCGCGESVSF